MGAGRGQGQGQARAGFLRAVNLGARNKVPMADLRTELTRRLGVPVRTHLASGNVLVPAVDLTDEDLREQLRAGVLAVSGVDTGLVIRSTGQLRTVLDGHGGLGEDLPDPTLLHVLLLAGDPDLGAAAELVAGDWGPDRAHVDGRAVYLRYATSLHTSRLQHAPVLHRLGVEGTARNWRTLTVVTEKLTVVTEKLTVVTGGVGLM